MFIGWSRDKNLISIFILFVSVIDSGAGNLFSCAPRVPHTVYISTRFIFNTCKMIDKRKINLRDCGIVVNTFLSWLGSLFPISRYFFSRDHCFQVNSRLLMSAHLRCLAMIVRQIHSKSRPAFDYDRFTLTSIDRNCSRTPSRL